jgi:arylsulfatase A-like enzyme
MYQTATDTHHMRSHRDDDFQLPAGVRPVTHRLHEAGYFTSNLKTLGDREIGTGKLDLNFVNEGDLYTSKTGKWAELKDNQPFFAQVNMPEAEYDIYDRKSAEKKRVLWVGEEWHPKVATPENVTPPPYYPDHPVAREEGARYLNSLSGTDVRIGWMLEALEKEGLADDTIVIFFSDNGRLEARGIHWPYDSGLHVPMIIKWAKNHPAPEQVKPGKVDEQVLSLIDLAPATLWMAGIDKPPLMHGRLFLGPDADPPRRYAFSARDRIDETEVRMRSVADGRYHYIRNYTKGAGFLTLNRYKEKCFLVKPLMRELHARGELSGSPADLMEPFPREMLFDLREDPHEVRNLAKSSDPAHRQALLRLRAALDTWTSETGDRGAIPEPREIVAPFLKEMHDWFGTPDWAEQPE